MKVQGVVTRDTGKDISALLNAEADVRGFDAVGFLGGAIAESNLDEHSQRLGVWPDVSFGLYHPAVKWIGPEADPIERHVEVVGRPPVARDTVANRERVRVLCWNAEWSIAYVAPRYKALLDRWGDPLEAWCRWNKPNMAGIDNPNRANYVRALQRAEAYRYTMAASVGEGIQNKMNEAGDTPVTHEWEEIHGLSVQKKAWGTKGLYVASQDGGDWVTAGPFPVAD